MCDCPEKETLLACKRLANAISPWLYSNGRPPESLNKLFLNWIDHHRPPTMAQVDQAIQEAKDKPASEKPNDRPGPTRSMYYAQN